MDWYSSIISLPYSINYFHYGSEKSHWKCKNHWRTTKYEMGNNSVAGGNKTSWPMTLIFLFLSREFCRVIEPCFIHTPIVHTEYFLGFFFWLGPFKNILLKIAQRFRSSNAYPSLHSINQKSFIAVNSKNLETNLSKYIQREENYPKMKKKSIV